MRVKTILCALLFLCIRGKYKRLQCRRRDSTRYAGGDPNVRRRWYMLNYSVGECPSLRCSGPHLYITCYGRLPWQCMGCTGIGVWTRRQFTSPFWPFFSLLIECFLVPIEVRLLRRRLRSSWCRWGVICPLSIPSALSASLLPEALVFFQSPSFPLVS